jgi:hypothetical protein
MNESKMKQVGCLIGGGLVLIVFGFFFTGLMGAVGTARAEATGGRDTSQLVLAGVGILMMICGIGTLIWGLILGILASKTGISRKEFRYPNCSVIIKFAINTAGEQVYDVYEGEDPDYKYYVQLQLPNGRKEEFRCAYPVFLNCGEGMKGEAVAQGNWLSQFIAYVGVNLAT